MCRQCAGKYHTLWLYTSMYCTWTELWTTTPSMNYFWLKNVKMANDGDTIVIRLRDWEGANRSENEREEMILVMVDNGKEVFRNFRNISRAFQDNEFCRRRVTDRPPPSTPTLLRSAVCECLFCHGHRNWECVAAIDVHCTIRTIHARGCVLVCVCVCPWDERPFTASCHSHFQMMVWM